MEDLTIETVYASSMLHKIGEFYLRANLVNDKKKAYELYKEKCNIESQDKIPYEVMSAYFSEKLNINGVQREYIEGILGHCDTSEFLPMLVSLGDKLSTGKSEDVDKMNKKQTSQELRNLVSILSSVVLEKAQNQRTRYKKVVRATQPEELLEESEDQQTLTESYKQLWEEFEKALSLRKEVSISQLYYIMREFTSNIPSSNISSKPSVSLFSHSSTSAAISAALYRQLEELESSERMGMVKRLVEAVGANEPDKQRDSILDEKIFCLLKADISGIQNFIYNIATENALMALKGRSFYVNYLLDTIAWKMLKEEGLYEPNLMYSGGGHFYMILPAKSAEKLGKYQEWVDNIMYKAHQLQLSVLLEVEPFSPRDLIENNFGTIFDNVSKKLKLKKYRKYETFVKSGEIFKPKDNPVRRCSYCGREISIHEYENGECKFCDSFSNLGTKLAKSGYIIFKRAKPYDSTINNVGDIFKSIGFEIEFTDNPKDEELIFALDKMKYDPYEVTYYAKTASYYYRKHGLTLASLEDIAKKAEGIQRWGILRGDVDNLGKIFRTGLSRDSKSDGGSISKISTLSFEMELIFTVYLEKMIEKDYPECVIVYSGGDDFFILGPWSDLLELAKDIRDMLDKFSGNNPNVTVSMAIEIAPADKYPIYGTATDCGESLDEAKEYRRNDKEKDAICVLGTPIGWEEFEKFNNLSYKLEKVIKNNVSRRILQLIYIADELYKEAQENKSIFKSWRFEYYIGRLKQSTRRDQQEAIDEIIRDILETRKSLYKYAALSARWVELMTR
ncbi:MAG: type III-A CRISPR-associated protein Cas10/Csm1 [Thermotogaceae bacterium]|nr:type III-A CRISPR-associated protein Cas10/Csm1 [Thermotogaceae bacterium]